MARLIVTYHAIADACSPVTVTAGQLASDLASLARAGFAFVTLDDCVAWIAGRCPLPERSVAITFDDGYASVGEAVPVLKDAGAPATVFAIAGRIGSDNAWPGQPAWARRLPLATAAELRAFASSGLAVGAHSWSHERLPRLPEDALAREIVDAGDRLEQIVGAAVRHYAYPYGQFGAREAALTRSRYDGATASTVRALGRGDDRAAMPRIDAHDLRVAASLGLLASPALGAYLAVRRAARRLRRRA